jgi:hypothetical protein
MRVKEVVARFCGVGRARSAEVACGTGDMYRQIALSRAENFFEMDSSGPAAGEEGATNHTNWTNGAGEKAHAKARRRGGRAAKWCGIVGTQ